MKRVFRLTGVSDARQAVRIINGQIDDDGDLTRGMSLELEPNIGTTEEFTDIRDELKYRGGADVSSKSGLALRWDRAVLVPLGR